MNDDTVTRQLQRRLQHCRSPRRHANITGRWSVSHPALADLGIDDIVEICRQGTTEQNPIVAALVELHQHADEDATTVLLSVCRPVLYGVVRRARRTAGVDSTPGTDPANFWAALGHVLATIDSSPPVDARGRPTPFLAHIGIAVFTTRKQLDASERRRHRYNRNGHGDDNRLIALTDDVIGEQHDRRWANEIHDLENQALCRVELSRINDAVVGGAVPLARWQRLVEHRITRSARVRSAERVAIHRTANRLSQLVGHAA